MSKCPYPGCNESANDPHAHNVLSGRVQGSDWASEYQAAFPVIDFAKNPDDFRVTRQSKVTIGGLLVPVSEEDREWLDKLFYEYELIFGLHCRALHQEARDASGYMLTATMHRMMERAAARTDDPNADPTFDYISIDPRDYTTFSAPDIGDLTVISIHTRPERCWFLGILKFESALGLSLGRMRVSRPTDKGMYPVTIRTNWRALTNKVKQEEVRSAYQRLIQGG